MAGVIREFGFRVPIVAKSDGSVVDDHLRLKAAFLLGLEKVPVLLADDMSEQLIQAFRLSVNKASEFAEWDMELFDLACKDLLDDDYKLRKIGFDDDELAGIMDRIGDISGDESDQSNDGSDSIPEPPANPVTRPGDLWVLGEHRLLW